MHRLLDFPYSVNGARLCKLTRCHGVCLRSRHLMNEYIISLFVTSWYRWDQALELWISHMLPNLATSALSLEHWHDFLVSKGSMSRKFRFFPPLNAKRCFFFFASDFEFIEPKIDCLQSYSDIYIIQEQMRVKGLLTICLLRKNKNPALITECRKNVLCVRISIQYLRAYSWCVS